jgi:hypothetical protein
MQLLHHQAVVVRAKENEMLLPARGVLTERGLSTLTERSSKKTIGAVPTFIGAEIVAL